MEIIKFLYLDLGETKDKMGILKTKPYKGKLKFLNEFFVPGKGKLLRKRVDNITEFNTREVK